MNEENHHLAREYPISVIVPCHNAAQTLEDCLTALLENDLTNVELIVVDDGSTDRTDELIESLDSSFETEIRYIRLSERRDRGPLETPA